MACLPVCGFVCSYVCVCVYVYNIRSHYYYYYCYCVSAGTGWIGFRVWCLFSVYYYIHSHIMYTSTFKYYWHSGKCSVDMLVNNLTGHGLDFPGWFRGGIGVGGIFGSGVCVCVCLVVCVVTGDVLFVVRACLSSLTLLAVSAGRHEAEARRADNHAAGLHRAVGRRIGEYHRSCEWREENIVMFCLWALRCSPSAPGRRSHSARLC